MNIPKIVFPEFSNEIIKSAIEKTRNLNYKPIETASLEAACKMVKDKQADAMIAGKIFSTREVILASKEIIGKSSNTFSGVMFQTKGNKEFLIADVAACKNPTEEQLKDIILDTFKTAQKTLKNEPKISVLSWSTLGSGGNKDETILKIRNAIKYIKEEHPEIAIDGEMQLDVAVNQEVAEIKSKNSIIKGDANVLICPDLNSGNILYKSLEQFGGFLSAGPILQGFNAPISDLSRGSTEEDIIKTIEVIVKLISS